MAKAYFVENKKITSYVDGKYSYSPGEAYPEYPWGNSIAKTANPVYDMVRRCLLLSGYDKEHAGQKNWNPFGCLIREGDTVLIKPNWVEDKNKNPQVKDHLACLVTNPSVLRPIIDYVAIALKGSGKIVLADAPMQGCNLQHMFNEAGYEKLFSFYKEKKLKMEVMDLRKYHVNKIQHGVISKPVQTENSMGSVIVELGKKSLHAQKDKNDPGYKVSDYLKTSTAKYHQGHHAYEINRIVLEADVIINVPKPKTHRLAGMTAAMKNFVGVTYEKASLPHRVTGAQAHGGDAYEKPSIWKSWMEHLDEKNTLCAKKGNYKKAWLYDFMQKACYVMGAVTSKDRYRVGSWYGNDTIWRTVADLNDIVLYADKKGQIQKTVQRKIITIGDMIICGEGEGPVGPSPKPLGMIMLAENNLLFDRVMCEIMGFEADKIPYLRSRKVHKMFGYDACSELEQEQVKTEETEWKVKEFVTGEKTHFRPHSCWAGNIEKDAKPVRVLNLFTIMDRGGAESMVMNYYRKIDRTKVQFDFLVHRKQKGVYEDEIIALGGRIYRMCPIYPQNFSRYQKMIRRFLDAHPEYRIIHSHMSELGYFVLKEASRRGIPVRICHSHCEYIGWDLKMFVRTYFKIKIRKYTNHMFACGMEAGDWLFGKQNRNRVRIINNAIDTQKFRYTDSIRKSMREKLGIDGKFVVGNVGRFHKQKNHTFLIDIFSEISKRREDAVLLLAGDGELKNSIMKKVDRLHLHDKVIFLGVRDDIPAVMQAMDVFLFPTLFEGFGIVVLEAQTAGVPCVISDRVPKTCVVTENVTVMDLKYPVTLWAEQVLAVNAENDRLTAYKQVAAAGFDIEDNAKQLEQFYIDTGRRNGDEQ